MFVGRQQRNSIDNVVNENSSTELQEFADLNIQFDTSVTTIIRQTLFTPIAAVMLKRQQLVLEFASKSH